jgi:uncharacterized membrane protein (DUF485 family)
MRKWLLFLVVLVVLILLSKVNRKKELRTPLGKKISETLSIMVWVLIIAYVISFIYWLYTQIFG